MTQRLDAVVAGVAVVDIIGRPVLFSRLPRKGTLTLIDSITMTTGGNVANCGTDLAKMGFRVGAITRVGDDALGAHLRSELSRHGIDTGGVRTTRGAQTSATIVAVGPDGERTFLHTRGALKRFRVEDILSHLDTIRRAKFFVFGYYGLLPECDASLPRLFRAVKEKTGAETLLDTGGNPVRNDRRLAAILQQVDYFLPSLDEARVLTGCGSPREIVRHLRALGARGTLGVKMGSRGCYLDVDGEARLCPRAVCAVSWTLPAPAMPSSLDLWLPASAAAMPSLPPGSAIVWRQSASVGLAHQQRSDPTRRYDTAGVRRGRPRGRKR